jgi:7-carboxy-7-deazaguanine synthase
VVVDELNINERFGLTIQGEGPSAGTPCAFVRLANCNQCCHWCDTGQTWAFTDAKAAKHQSGKKYDKAAEVHPQKLDDIVQWFTRLPWAPGRQPLGVISGGEPMLQQPGIVNLLLAFPAEYARWEIETAGTIPTIADLAALADVGYIRFNCSPKLSTSGNPLQVRRKLDVLKELATFRDTAFKFVVTRAYDLEEIDELVNLAGIKSEHVYLMPEGTHARSVLNGMRNIVPYAIERGYNLTTRMHTLIWGDERGR